MFNWLFKKVQDPNKVAYERIKTLIDVMSDINPDVKEIRKIAVYYGNRLFEIDTAQGLRYIHIDGHYFGFYENVWDIRRKNNSGAETLKFKRERVFGIQLTRREYDSYVDIEDRFHGTSYSYRVEILPRLHESAHITEEQIFLCLKEIEDILSKYEEKTLTEANKNRLNKFVKRFV